jgi:hypothetical protein
MRIRKVERSLTAAVLGGTLYPNPDSIVLSLA